MHLCNIGNLHKGISMSVGLMWQGVPAVARSARAFWAIKACVGRAHDIAATAYMTLQDYMEPVTGAGRYVCARWDAIQVS